MTDRVSPPETLVLLAVLSLDRSTVRSVALAAGRSVSVTWGHLHALRAKGLLAWEDGKQGTLRATVRPVPFGEAA